MHNKESRTLPKLSFQSQYASCYLRPGFCCGETQNASLVVEQCQTLNNCKELRELGGAKELLYVKGILYKGISHVGECCCEN